MSDSWLPAYLEEVPSLSFYDPLGALLTGYTGKNSVQYHFRDIVKMSGHSCPTVAGAYAMTLVAMEHLYGENEIAVRGEIRIEAPSTQSSGGMGPFTQVMTYLTGACAENGFNGLGGKFVRRGLLTFSGTGDARSPFHFTRLDTGKRIGVVYHPEKIPGGHPKMGTLMEKSIMEIASDSERAEFGKLWQERVRYILVDASHRKELFEVIGDAQHGR